MPYSTKSIFVGISVGVCTVLGTYLLRKWLQRYEQDTENRTQAPNNGRSLNTLEYFCPELVHCLTDKWKFFLLLHIKSTQQVKQ